MNFLYCLRDSSTEDVPVFNLTQQISSAFFPRFRYATNIAYVVGVSTFFLYPVKFLMWSAFMSLEKLCNIPVGPPRYFEGEMKQEFGEHFTAFAFKFFSPLLF